MSPIPTVAPEQTAPLTQESTETPTPEQTSEPTGTPTEVAQPKKKGRPRKTKAQREAEKAQKERLDAEKARQVGAALAKDLLPLGPPPSTGKVKQLKEKTDKAHRVHGQGSFGARGSPVFATPGARPSSSPGLVTGPLGAGPSLSPSPSSSRSAARGRFVSDQVLNIARSLAKELEKDQEGKEKRKGAGKSKLDTVSVILYRHREALTVIALVSLHTTGFPNQFG